MKTITITISQYIALNVGYKENAIVDSQDALRLARADKFDYSDKASHTTLTLNGDFEGENFYLECLPANQDRTILYRLWPRQNWLNSLEHRKRLQEASEASRQRNFLKAEVWEKLRLSLGLPCGGISGSGIMEIVKAMKAANPSCLLSLGLTQSEIDAI